MSTSAVAVGGGHGLSASLRALRLYADPVVGVVSIADDGGSSGILRASLGVAPPGDLRKCLVALGDNSSVWARAFEHRFGSPDPPAPAGWTGGGVEGHPLGNLVITGLAETTGSLQAALDLAGALVGSTGRIMPATEVPVVLRAVSDDGEIEGQVAVSRTGHLVSVSVDPGDPPVPGGVLAAIAAADQVILGPGSLFTSVLAAIVPSITRAIKEAPGRKIYVCNLAAQEPETRGFDVGSHVAALVGHGVDVDTVVCDTSAMPLGTVEGPGVVDARIAGPDRRSHDPGRLAEILAGLV